jgi:hypothetical protein
LDVHGFWLGHERFLRECVREADGEAWVLWKGVRAWLVRVRCSALEAEVLLLAADLAESRSARRFVESVVFDDLEPAVRDAMAAAARQRGSRGRAAR